MTSVKDRGFAAIRSTISSASNADEMVERIASAGPFLHLDHLRKATGHWVFLELHSEGLFYCIFRLGIPQREAT